MNPPHRPDTPRGSSIHSPQPSHGGRRTWHAARPESYASNGGLPAANLVVRSGQIVASPCSDGFDDDSTWKVTDGAFPTLPGSASNIAGRIPSSISFPSSNTEESQGSAVPAVAASGAQPVHAPKNLTGFASSSSTASARIAPALSAAPAASSALAGNDHLVAKILDTFAEVRQLTHDNADFPIPGVISYLAPLHPKLLSYTKLV